MKESEIRKRAKCLICEKPFGHTGLPSFWTIKIERHRISIDAIQRQSGLSAFLGSPTLASVMGADEEMSEPVLGIEATICEDCSTKQICLAELAELGTDD